MNSLPDHPAVRRADAAVDWLVVKAGRRMAIDLRALAALRISLGALVLADLLLRSRSFVAFYTDRGVYPIAYLNDPLSEPYSIHAYSGSVEFQALLFVVAGLFALSMLLGYRTRVATAASWILLLSLQHRNPLVLNSGDVLLRMLLFWGIFLPLGERWSIDARRIDRDRVVVASLATLGIMIQVVLVYAVNAVHKLRSDEWMGGTAIEIIMQLEHFTVFLGPYLAEFPLLLRGVTYLWAILIISSPLLLLLTGWPRVLLATGIAGTHVGMALTMQIGLFPLVSVASLLVFYPPSHWDRLDRVAADSGVSGRLGTALDRLHAFDPLRAFDGLLSTRVRASDRLPDDVPSPWSALSTILMLALIPSIVVSGAASVEYADTPERSATLLDHTEMDQHWQMFAPDPVDTTRWYAGAGSLTDGTRVDPFHGGSTSLDRPPNPADSVRTARWRKYLVYVQYHTPTNHPDRFGNYLCERWNRTHDTSLANVTVYGFHQQIGLDGPTSSVERDTVVSDYDCSGDLIQA